MNWHHFFIALSMWLLIQTIFDRMWLRRALKQIDVALDIADELKHEKRLLYTITDQCPKCAGRGKVPGDDEGEATVDGDVMHFIAVSRITCPRCGGLGRVEKGGEES